MSSQPNKRKLPAWMKRVHEQNQKKSSSDATSLQQAAAADISTVKKAGTIAVPECAKYEEADERTFTNEKTEVRSSNYSLVCEIGKSKVPEPVNKTAEQIISESMPLLTFRGRTIYSCHFSDCACLCQDILASFSGTDKILAGFDSEWVVNFNKGSSSKTSLIQLYITDVCYLFHISPMLKFPEPLKQLICDARLVLIGLNIDGDLWKLERDFDIGVKSLFNRGSVIDVGKIANEKLKSSQRWSLDGLCKNVLKQRLNKSKALQCGDWNSVPLSAEQRLYAATDAYACLILYQRLKDI